MALNKTRSFCDGASDQCKIDSFSPNSRHAVRHKPIEIYSFIDPTCPECWALEPILRKLQIEYGEYFKMRYLIGARLNPCTTKTNKEKSKKSVSLKWRKDTKRLGMPCHEGALLENPVSSLYHVSIAVKAAELQGKRAGLHFLRKLRESFFLDNENISDQNVLIRCAIKTGLDIKEFQRDIKEGSAVKAFRCDMKTTLEMEIDHLPTLVFLNATATVEEEGVKISGCYPYEAYEQIIYEILKDQPKTSEPPEIEDFLKKYSFVATNEIAVVYNLTNAEAEHKMKELVLKQIVERIPIQNGTFWRYLAADA